MSELSNVEDKLIFNVCLGACTDACACECLADQIAVRVHVYTQTDPYCSLVSYKVMCTCPVYAYNEDKKSAMEAYVL